ncbi:hypothetical protein [uncultured Desulfovibrio sp.]|uniref:hypothetical protein n=1 Tax=uncultured Desulfovibrio sp. TaxID=167968 RepID=UPI002065B361|nr:hypothetical protein [uncultured Desulfovibrio sp.]DAV75465.1 MAG TPA: hypothetical protein [Caudoviricetes sp.]
MGNPENAARHNQLSRKHIKGFAGGIAHQFACSAQHYAWLAHKHHKQSVTIDLFKLRIEPSEFDIERNRNLAAMCRDNLLKNTAQLVPTAAVVSATMHADFGIGDYSAEGGAASIGRSVFTVRLVDDRGKEWVGVHEEARVLAQS